MNNKKVLRAKRLFLPLAMPGAILILWLTALTAKSQADYYLFPATIYDYDTYVGTGDFLVSGNDLQMVGTCTYDGGWTSCGAEIAMQRPIDQFVYGVMVDWNDGTVDTQEFPRPQAIGVDLSGQGPLLATDSAAGCANPGVCPSPYDGRICYTDLTSGDLTDLSCDEESGIWLTEAISDTNDSMAVFVVNNTGGTLDIIVDVTMYWIVAECPEGYSTDLDFVCVDEGPPPPPPVEFPTCSFNYTATITTTAGTGSATYSYTVSANLIQNGSFENADSGGYFPAFWTFVSDVPPLTNNWWGNSSLLAYSGVRYMDSYQQDQRYSLVQDLQLYSSGQYQAGFYARPSGHYLNSFGQVRMIWSGSMVAQSALVTNTWQVFSGTRATGGGSAWLEMSYFSLVPGSSTDVYGDHAFIWPVDESGDILCDPDYYPVPPGQPVTSTVPSDQCAIVFGGLCFPTVGDASCWDCQRPNSLIQIGEWIAWLLCQIRNLFFCHLYQWVLVTANWITGLYQNVVLFFQWIPNIVQNALAWLGNVWDTGIGWINEVWGRVVTGFTNWLRVLVQNILNSSFVQAVFNFVAGVSYVWDLFVSLIELFLDMLRAIYNGILDLISLVINLVLAVREALLAEAYDWDFLPGFSGETEVEISREAAIADEGGATWSETQAIYIFLMALGAGDAVLAEFGIQYIQFLIIGAISIGLIWWTLRKWEYILPV